MSSIAINEWIRAATQQVVDAGFKTDLWVPLGGIWSPSEVEASNPIYPEQLLCALMAFFWLYAGPSKRAWVHVAAEMQAGKSGVMAALIRMVYSNIDKLGVAPHKVFVLTGMSDNSWVKQTKNRLPEQFRRNVWHNAQLGKVRAMLAMLHERDDLRNLLFIVDESQIASGGSNCMSTHVYAYLRSKCPVSEWTARGIRFVTVSATDPAKVLEMDGETSKTVRLLTTDKYQSVETMNSSGRIRYIEVTGEIHTEEGMNSLRADVDSFGEPRYHLIRPRPSKHDAVKSALLATFPGCTIVEWDSKRKQRKQDDASSADSEMDDINDLLKNEPVVQTFVILKNMFYAAKTMNDKYVGVAVDRLSTKDETNLQGLLGRLCGYEKSVDTIVYTSKATVDRWISCWKELCASDATSPIIAGHDAKDLHGKMTNVVASALAGGGAQLSTRASAASPMGIGQAYDFTAPGPEPARGTVCEDDFSSEWREFTSFAAAKAWGRNIHAKKKDANGFEMSSTTGAARKLLVRDVMALRNGKKTAAMPTDHKKRGDVRDRLFVQYTREDDNTSGQWVVHRLTRITDVD
jgi:hypothetical protein